MNNAYPLDRVMPGAMARLLSEDGHEMTRAANESPQHVGNLARWIGKAREQNPGLDDEQAVRLGRMLKDEFYKGLAARGVAARQGRPLTVAGPVARGPVEVRCASCGRSWEVPAKPDGTRPKTARCAQRHGGCGRTVHVPQRANRPTRMTWAEVLHEPDRRSRPDSLGGT